MFIPFLAVILNCDRDRNTEFKPTAKCGSTIRWQLHRWHTLLASNRCIIWVLHFWTAKQDVEGIISILRSILHPFKMLFHWKLAQVSLWNTVQVLSRIHNSFQAVKYNVSPSCTPLNVNKMSQKDHTDHAAWGSRVIKATEVIYFCARATFA